MEDTIPSHTLHPVRGAPQFVYDSAYSSDEHVTIVKHMQTMGDSCFIF